ncbi:MAG: SUMF1/EgtB/PvdO family nonheme iron enzyme, partial [Planctomycetes bacterium]|nr:SUMF1/EgtB/PvdO family nonheme iron enzyme [Planctomycetota bacterium]
PPLDDAQVTFRFARGSATVSVLARRGARPFRLGDARELAEGGGVAATVYREGKLSTSELPVGLLLRTTAAPLLLTPECRVPAHGIEVPEGDYLLVVQCAGHELTRHRFHFSGLHPTELQITPWPVGTTPPGFVRLGDHDLAAQEHEVTAGDYLVFLNDPSTLAEIDASDRPKRFPRNVDNALSGGFWERRGKNYHLPAGWHPDMPVVGVSWRDASAYAAWYTARRHGSGDGWRYRLPRSDEWMYMLSQHDAGRRFAYGDTFRPLWSKSCNARPWACVERVMQFPIDESPLGIYDLTGGAAEWLETVYNPLVKQRWIGEGSWAQAQSFRFGNTTGAGEDAVMETFGFRLMAVREPRPPARGK